MGNLVWRQALAGLAMLVFAAGSSVAAVQDDYDALASHRAVLAREPDNQAALLGEIRALARLGAPQLALEIADRHPGILDPAERAAIAADRTAHQIRWGAITADTGRGPERFAGIDRALADSNAAETRALDPAAELTAPERQLALDRIGALRERFRMRDAIALYEAMARRAEVPAYATSDAAAAYLYLERPEKARDLYREALATDPGNLEAQIGLFYALAESEEHGAALAQVERAAAATPAYIDAWSPATIRENPAYARVQSARAMAPLFANRPGEAWARLGELSSRAPYNMEIRTDYASSMRARGWPRTAEEELRWVLAVDPDNSGALGERAGALLEMRDYRGARKALAEAQAVAAEDGRVQRAARLLRVHEMRELVVDGYSGRSSGGGPTGTRDYGLDARLYSSPIADNYRFFAHTYNAEALYATGTGQINRAGAGFEYRSPLFMATGELAHDLNDSHTGAAATLAYTPNDYWTFRGAYATRSNETPLQARLAGVNARLGSVEAVWRAHESRSAALSLAQMDFSDGNRRNAVLARWTERVVAGPVYQLEITGGLYASRNSLAAAPYFNPSRDFSPTVEFANQWIQWRRYTREFRHRVVLTAGSYQQQGFGTGPVAGIRYEQEWDADDRLALRYGVGRTQHPYDGVRTTRDFLYLSLNWRF